MFTEPMRDDTLTTSPEAASGEVVPARRWMALRVAEVAPEADGILRFSFEAADADALPRFTAGAHVEVRIGEGTVRSYSLCNDPAERNRYVVAVQREDGGRGGSVAMHEGIRAGDTVEVSTPRNHFPLAGREATSHLLVAGGIGVTPMIAMIHELEARGAEWHLHYCTRSPERTAFREALAPFVLAGRVTLHHDGGDPARSLDIASAAGAYRPGVHAYYCGPAGFMSAAKAAFASWPQHCVHFEHFSAPEDREAPEAENGPFEIKLRSTGAVVEVPADKTIVDVLRENGVVIDTDCEDGYCGTCITRFFGGDPDHRDTVLSEGERRNYMMVCCSRARGRLELDI